MESCVTLAAICIPLETHTVANIFMGNAFPFFSVFLVKCPSDPFLVFEGDHFSSSHGCVGGVLPVVTCPFQMVLCPRKTLSDGFIHVNMVCAPNVLSATARPHTTPT